MPQHTSSQTYKLARVFDALSDPVRLEIVRILDEKGEASCSDLDLEIPLPTLSHHYKILRDAGIVQTSVDGRRRVNSLCRDEMETEFPGLLDCVLRTLKK